MSRRLFYPALSLALLTGAASAQEGALPAVPSAAPAATERPSSQLRHISIPFVLSEAQLERAAGRRLVIAQPLPRGVQVVGSSELDGQAAAPLSGQTAVYWTLPPRPAACSPSR